LIAFGAGVAFFFSPCCWPLYPAYLSYLTGAGAVPAGRARLIVQAAAFVLGFSVVFVALGASASLAGRLLVSHQVPLRKLSGLAIIALGAAMAGLLPSWLLGRELRPAVKPGGTRSLVGAAGLGVAFGFGWTPCAGPVLASILLLAGNAGQVGRGAALLAVYALGLAVPFLALAAGFDRLRGGLGRLTPHLPRIQRGSGALLMVLGWLVYSGYLSTISWALYYGVPR
jgi:cytochrome c-type biogenesis protein